MAISPISSVSFNNYNNVTFAGRKNKEHHNNVSNPVSHKLAIPVAALVLSMYPSNISAQNNFNTDKVTELYKITDNFKILHSRVLENWSEPTDDGKIIPKLTVHFIDTDKNEDSIEGIILEQTYNKRRPDEKIFLKSKWLKVTDYAYSNGEVYRTEYKMQGDATIIKPTGVRKTNLSLDISEKSFNYLKQFIDSEVNNGAIGRFIVTEKNER